MSEGAPKKVKVLYIACWGRSGSTILDTLLGQTEKFFSSGELFQIWQHGLIDENVCGCGQPVKQCPVWKPILETAFESIDQIDPHKFVAWQDEHARTRNILNLQGTIDKLTLQNDPILQELDRFYRVIATHNEANVIIDSSKHPMYAAILSQLPSVDLYMLHLVRNPYALAHSWKRKKIMPDKNRYFRIRPAYETSMYWDVWNVSTEYVARKINAKYLCVRYEDFIKMPHQTLQQIYRFVDEAVQVLPLNETHEFQMKTNHTIVGNPIKFKHGTIRLQMDDEWKSKISRMDKAMVSAITVGLMQRYGYKLA